MLERPKGIGRLASTVRTGRPVRRRRHWWIEPHAMRDGVEGHVVHDGARHFDHAAVPEPAARPENMRQVPDPVCAHIIPLHRLPPRDMSASASRPLRRLLLDRGDQCFELLGLHLGEVADFSELRAADDFAAKRLDG